ncbi:MAG: hypothetical protein ICV83_35845, partial [Cytophagales bacterium]|nr:hypothetical protein [Cytophagales bacterium]
NYSLDRSPDNQASLRMTATLKALEGAVRHGDDRLKAEAKPLIAESHRLIEAEKKEGRLDRERLRVQTGKLIDFLERAAAGA